MAIKAGQILHDVNGYVIDRIQTGGPGSLNIPEERIYELGNYQTVAIVRDIPDLSFDLESLDVSTEFESVLTNNEPIWAGGATTEFDFNTSVPIDVVSPFKSVRNEYNIVKGLVVPCLSLERVTYRFGVRQNSTQSFTLRGDSIYYVPGVPHYESVAYGGGANDAYTFSFNGSNGTAAIKFTEAGNDIYALSVTLVKSSNGAYKRLFFGDYTNTTTGFTILEDWSGDGYDTVRFTYASNATNTVYGQSTAVVGGPAAEQEAGQKAHQGTSVKPAAVRGKDIDVYIGKAGGTPVWQKFKGVQSAEVSRSVNLENDEELGNHHYVSQDYLTPEVRGSLGVKPYDLTELWSQLARITGVSASEVIGPQLNDTVDVKIIVRDPDEGTPLKAIYVPNARFQVPGMSGRANQKLETTFNFTSDTGEFKVYDGTDTAGVSVA